MSPQSQTDGQAHTRTVTFAAHAHQGLKSVYCGKYAKINMVKVGATIFNMVCQKI